MIKAEKEVLFFAIALSLIFIFTSSTNVSASLGITPAKYQVNFEPGMSSSFGFSIVGVSEGKKLKTYLEGDLAEYATLDKNETFGEEGLTVFLNLPQSVEKPGKNMLYLIAEEISDKETGIAVKMKIGALISIMVPYPGKYAEFSFSSRDANEGEPVDFTITVNNLGKEDITASSKITVYDSESREAETLNLGTKFIKTQTSDVFAKSLDTKNYKPGIYKAHAVVDYGKTEQLNSTFKIGTLFVNVTNWTSEFKKGKISKFEVEIESRWNNEIENVYASINVTEDSKSADFFKTPSSNLKPWEKTILSGYFNAENIKAGRYDAKITLFYLEKTTEKIIEIEIKKPKMEKIATIAVIAVLAVIIFITGLFLWRKYGKKRKNKKNGKNKGKE